MANISKGVANTLQPAKNNEEIKKFLDCGKKNNLANIIAVWVNHYMLLLPTMDFTGTCCLSVIDRYVSGPVLFSWAFDGDKF